VLPAVKAEAEEEELELLALGRCTTFMRGDGCAAGRERRRGVWRKSRI
jgi:hypothetical protein